MESDLNACSSIPTRIDSFKNSSSIIAFRRPRWFATSYEFLYERTEDPIELTQQEIRELLDLPLSAEAVGTSLQVLSRSGVLERLESGAGLAMVRISSDLPTLVDLFLRRANGGGR